MLYADAGIGDTFVKAHFDMHSRFPVCKKRQQPKHYRIFKF